MAVGMLPLMMSCSLLLLLHLVHGFSPSKNVAINYDIRFPEHTNKRWAFSSPVRMRKQAPPPAAATATTRLLASKHNIDSRNEISTAGSSVALAASASSSLLNPIEAWCTTHMNVWYDKSMAVKCPFFRRRMTDFLDGADMVMRFLVIRHKSLDLIGPPPGCRSTKFEKKGYTKHKHLDLEALVDTIRDDWNVKPYHQHKGYYITGKLNTTIYRDDCWFEGPDPDMPVRGVRKYLNAASQLFDVKTSTAELLSLEIGNDDNNNNDKNRFHHRGGNHKRSKATIVARWKLKGVLHLPWHPSLPVWTGTTTYHLDDEHMVYRHEEHWDISVLRAFTQTLWPEVGNCLWKTAEETGEDEVITSMV